MLYIEKEKKKTILCNFNLLKQNLTTSNQPTDLLKFSPHFKKKQVDASPIYYSPHPPITYLNRSNPSHSRPLPTSHDSTPKNRPSLFYPSVKQRIDNHIISAPISLAFRTLETQRKKEKKTHPHPSVKSGPVTSRRPLTCAQNTHTHAQFFSRHAAA